MNPRLKSFIDNARYHLGMVSKEELMKALRPDREEFKLSLPFELSEVFEETCQFTEDIRNMKNAEQIYQRLSELHSQTEYLTKSMRKDLVAEEEREKVVNLLSADSTMNYTPAGSRMWRFFFNPMGMFTFIGENHWATKAALNILRVEMADEGTKYKYHPDVTPERLMQVDQQLHDLDLFDFAIDMAIRYVVYGNVYTLPEKNMMGQKFKLTNLAADRMWPVYSHNGEELEGFEYQIGTGTIRYETNEILHLKAPSLRSKHIGSPRLAALVTDIEADLAASSLQNAIMNKAGMIGVIIALEDPAIKNPMRAVNMERQQERMQKTTQTQFSGVRGAHSVMVANYVRDVYKLTDIGGMDASFLNLRAEVAKSVCILLGVPPERLSIPRSGSQQYQAASVENIVAASFDKQLNVLTRTIWSFLNKHVLKDMLGIYDVEVMPRGRFSSNTINGAKMAYMASMTGPIFDVNEARSLFFKVPELPPDDPRGRIILDNSTLRNPTFTPPSLAIVDERDQIIDLPTLNEEPE